MSATVRALILYPWRHNTSANFAVLFDDQRNGDIGSPRVAGSTSRSSSFNGERNDRRERRKHRTGSVRGPDKPVQVAHYRFLLVRCPGLVGHHIRTFGEVPGQPDGVVSTARGRFVSG